MKSGDWIATESVDGHEWGFHRSDAYESCRICCMMRRADKKHSPCTGRPKVTFRATK